MAKIKCFMIEPTNHCARWLRRYSEFKDYHNAMVRIEDGPVIISAEGYISTDPMQWPRDDPRWPVEDSGYKFTDRDVWQLFYERLYVTPDGLICCISNSRDGVPIAPPGAMFYSDWWPDKGPDGHCVSVMLPDGVAWMIDGPSNNGDGWTRTGVPPILTARPSILTSKYHGYLTDGFLEDC